VSLYRKPGPIRKPQTYRGLETAAGVAAPGYAAVHRLPASAPAAHAAVARVPWLDATQHGTLVRLPMGEHGPVAAVVRLPSASAAPFSGVQRVRWSKPRQRYRKPTPYRKARSYRGLEAFHDPAQAASRQLPWQLATAHDRQPSLPWAETSQRLATTTRAPHRVADAVDVTLRAAWGTLAARSQGLSAFWDNVRAHGALFALPWSPLAARQGGYFVPWPVEPNPGDPGSDPITVPILPVYVMIPTLTAVRLPERTPVRLISASIATDAASWGWSFQAALPTADLPLVNPSTRAEPVELEVTVNGYTWTFLVEAFDDQRRFGLKTASIRGRSRSAILAEPYAPPRSRTQTASRNASQLGDEELTGTGWTLLWDCLDWLVPGGTWSYADLAPIDALVRLAGSIGARLETDRALLQLAAKPGYDVSPWEWGSATPYAILPANIVTLADGSWQGGPNANGVYVYSENAGFGALVKLTGTAGEVQIPMVVERLTTSADPARERGRQELARSSRIKTEQVTIPLFPSPADPGLIPIGALLEISDGSATWRGQCQAVRIDAQRNGTAFSVRQSLQVERHFR
jgi:hypothetical protein